MADAVSGILGRPFAEQVAAFRLRLGDLRPTSAWTDLAGQDHDRAFMVAGAVKADLLADLAAAVDKAITEGTTLETFRKDFREIVTRRGWHGWTGEGTKGGEAWRTRVIYRTNMATTYAAGRHAQLTQGGFAFWVYRHGGSAEPRLDHLSWDGVALPPDHPFWATHYPPNGWGCSCRVFGARTAAGVRRVGGDPAKVLPDGWQRISPRTGTPVGIDKGWNHAPGRTVAEDILALVGRKAEALPPPLAAGLLAHVDERLREVATPSPQTPEAAIALGRELLKRFLDEPLADDFAMLSARGKPLADLISRGFHDVAAPPLRDRIMSALASRRPVGTVQIALVPRTTRAAKAVMGKVASVMPSDWVDAANASPLAINVTSSRGSYSGGPSPKIRTDDSSTAVHEYLHHIQFVVAGLDALFQDLHRKRTAGDRKVAINSLRETGRPDGYFDAYQGREYGTGTGGAYEVLTMALQPILGDDAKARDYLARMLKKDREMLEFALGVLFFWRSKGGT